jgi:hypothetical protein
VDRITFLAPVLGDNKFVKYKCDIMIVSHQILR